MAAENGAKVEKPADSPTSVLEEEVFYYLYFRLMQFLLFGILFDFLPHVLVILLYN